ncbi:MAG: hypothetical protein OXG90_09870 [Gammaproteobacteria bacterium]|nr:hypothetical protein [Gammaproteobacteria bacterium]
MSTHRPGFTFFTAEVWQTAFHLMRCARAQGITVPATDILIAACALHHGASVEAADKDFDLLEGV